MSKEEIAERAGLTLDAWEQGEPIDEISFADDIRNLIAFSIANKATEEGELPLDLMKQVIRDALGNTHIEDGTVAAFDQVVDELAIAVVEADRASRQVANKAEVDLSKLTRWTFDEGMTAAARKDGQWYEVDAVERLLATPPATTGASTAPRPTDDELWDATLRDRDAYHDWADKLADAIANYFGVDIGEHSNQNLPWDEALQAIENAEPVGASTVLTDERVEEVAQAMAKHAGWEGWHTAKNYNDTLAGNDPEDEREYWRELAKVAAQAGQVAPADLHDAIMLLRETSPYDPVRHSTEHVAYKCGHRDARHAAAELAVAVEAGQVAVPGWISVDERLPDSGYCLATYRNRHGKLRIIRAKYARQYEIDAGEDAIDQGNCEYNEADDTFYLNAGWLECIDNWDEYSSIYVTEGEVTHWMPLPATPSPAKESK